MFLAGLIAHTPFYLTKKIGGYLGVHDLSTVSLPRLWESLDQHMEHVTLTYLGMVLLARVAALIMFFVLYL